MRYAHDEHVFAYLEALKRLVAVQGAFIHDEFGSLGFSGGYGMNGIDLLPQKNNRKPLKNGNYLTDVRARRSTVCVKVIMRRFRRLCLYKST